MTTYVHMTFEEGGLRAHANTAMQVLLERDPLGAVLLVEQLAAELRAYAEQLDRLAERTRGRTTNRLRAEAVAASDRRAREEH